MRKYSWIGKLDRIENGDGRLETREWEGEFGIEFHSSDRFNVTYGAVNEFLSEPFGIASDVTLPVGGYEFASVRTSYNFGQQRRVSGNLSFERGSFYSGHKTTLGISRGRFNLTPRLSLGNSSGPVECWH